MSCIINHQVCFDLKNHFSSWSFDLHVYMIEASFDSKLSFMSCEFYIVIHSLLIIGLWCIQVLRAMLYSHWFIVHHSFKVLILRVMSHSNTQVHWVKSLLHSLLHTPWCILDALVHCSNIPHSPLVWVPWCIHWSLFLNIPLDHCFLIHYMFSLLLF